MSAAVFTVGQTPAQIDLPPVPAAFVLNSSAGIGDRPNASDIVVNNSTDCSLDPQQGCRLPTGPLYDVLDDRLLRPPVAARNQFQQLYQQCWDARYGHDDGLDYFSILMASLEDAVQKDRATALRALRDRLAAEIDQADKPRDVAVLSARLTDVLTQLEKVAPAKKVSAVDEVARKRAARRNSR